MIVEHPIIDDIIYNNNAERWKIIKINSPDYHEYYPRYTIESYPDKKYTIESAYIHNGHWNFDRKISNRWKKIENILV